MRGLLRSEQPGTVLAGVKATPCGWPTASPDPGCGRSRMTTGGADREKNRARSTQLESLRFEGIAGCPTAFAAVGSDRWVPARVATRPGCVVRPMAVVGWRGMLDRCGGCSRLYGGDGS